ncbi:MAG: PmeII family type II restriction endonuclease [Thermodesulfovibrionales bacterium]|jgi:hypothetical protein|nr:PmeII family type II restriction endonuclease [Thermodesulfovibrionales bacterium]
MPEITKKDMVSFIETNIQTFHTKRLENLLNLKLNDILKRKNPYLFKAKNLVTAPDLVKSLLDAHLSSQEEGIFGGFLEELAIFICSKIFGGRKSSAEGIDLEFEKGDTKYIVVIKSGPNWGNSQQVLRMRDNFRKAKRILRTNTLKANITAVNGCCYGIDDNPDKGDYLKLCGQRFWSFISGDENLFTEIIEPLGHRAKERNERFLKEYAKVINKFTLEFVKEYCAPDGSIIWDKIVRFNSAKRKNIELIF